MERYLNRELTEDESDWFEAYLLDRPRLAGEIEADRCSEDVAGNLPGISNHHRRGMAKVAGLALALIGVVASFQVGLNSTKLNDFDLVIGRSLTLSQMRGTARNWIIEELPSGGNATLINIPATSGGQATLEIRSPDEHRRIGPTLPLGGFYSFVDLRYNSRNEMLLIDSNGTVSVLPMPEGEIE